MPELPEVETTVSDLRKAIVGLTFVKLWTDWAKNLEVLTPVVERPGRSLRGRASPKAFSFKREKSERIFKEALLWRRILGVERRGKFMVLRLGGQAPRLRSGQATLLIHMKLTGHLLVGRWRLKGRKWLPGKGSPALKDRWNSYLRWVATFDNGRQLAFSDLRRFGRFKLVLANIKLDGSLTGIKELDELGPEPFSPQFTLQYFRATIKKRRVPIKTVLLDQSVVAGLGNIYADETLWHARLNPKRQASALKPAEVERIYKVIPAVLKEGIKRRGTTIGDYRSPDGGAGGYQKVRRAYQRHGEPCARCGTIMKRLKINGRGTHFCPQCQK